MFTRKFAVFAVLVSLSGFMFSGCAEMLQEDEQDEGRILMRNRQITRQYEDLLAQSEQQKKDIQSLSTYAKQLQESIDGLNKLIQEQKNQIEANLTNIKQLQAKLDEETALRKKFEQMLAEANAQIAALLARLNVAEQESSTYRKMAEKMNSEIQKGTITLKESKGKLTLNVSDKVLFDSGKIEIKKEGLEVLKKVAEVLKSATDREIRIEGHTDNIKISGKLADKYPTNWELSANRATNVARFLVETGGLDPTNLYAAGFGEFRPTAPNDTPENRAKNRRIEITLLPKDTDSKDSNVAAEKK